MSLFRSLALSLICLCGATVLAGRPALAQEKHPLPPTVAGGARLTVEYEAEHFFEGPTWDPGTGKLYFTSFPSGERVNTQILRLDERGRASVWMDKTEGINGTYLAKDGRLLGAQAFGHNLYSMRIGRNGPEDLKSLTNNHQGITYIQPNDVCQSLVTGGIYYTDPNFAGRTRSAVYYLGTDGQVRRIIENLKVPNGVEVSNDGKTLFVGDSFERRIYSYPILPDGTVDQGKVRVFFDPQTSNMNDPDGMCTDADGNLYFAMRGGVWVATPEGKSLGLIPIPEFCSNVTFGGPDGKTLYMTCSKKLYSLRMNVTGPRRN